MHCYLRRSVIPKVSSWKRNEILPSFCNFRYRNLFDNHSFSTRSHVSNYNKGKQHFLFFTFSKIMFSLTAFLKKNILKNSNFKFSIFCYVRPKYTMAEQLHIPVTLFWPLLWKKKDSSFTTQTVVIMIAK